MHWIWSASAPFALLLAGCGHSRTEPAPRATLPRSRPEHGIVAVAWPGGAGRGLIVADTLRKQLRVYRLEASSIRLAAARSYVYDLRAGPTPPAPGKGFTYEEIRALVERGLAGTAGDEPPGGSELVLTTEGEGRDPGEIILINPTEKRILTYRLRDDSLLLVAARPYEYDEKLLYTSGKGGGYSYEAVRKLVESTKECRPELRAAKIRGLVGQLGHHLSGVRRAAAEDLGNMHPAAVEARRALERALTDRSSSVRQAAAVALEKIKTSEDAK